MAVSLTLGFLFWWVSLVSLEEEPFHLETILGLLYGTSKSKHSEMMVPWLSCSTAYKSGKAFELFNLSAWEELRDTLEGYSPTRIV